MKFKTNMLIVASSLVLMLSANAGTYNLQDKRYNQDVTQENLKVTVCKPGYSASIRPPASYTNKVKTAKLKAMSKEQAEQDTKILGHTPTRSDYELDHVVSLVAGGSPRNVENLQLQLWAGSNGASAKDKVEKQQRDKLCSGKITLQQARECLGGDWMTCK